MCRTTGPDQTVERADAPAVLLEYPDREPITEAHAIRWHDLLDDQGRRVFRDVDITVEGEAMRVSRNVWRPSRSPP